LLNLSGKNFDHRRGWVESLLLELVYDTGRIFEMTSVALSISAKLLTRLNIPQDNWLKLTTEFGKLFHSPVGTL
jgi:hypothetical protein